MSRNIPIKGLKELDAVLATLPDKMQTSAYRSALTAAAAVIGKEARLRAPKKTGGLAKSIKWSTRRLEDGTFRASIGPKKHPSKHGFLGLFHEYGVAAHAIASTPKGVGRVGLNAAIGAGNVSQVIQKPLKINDGFATWVMHPGHAAQPFMRPALDAKADEAVQAFADRIKRFLGEKTGFNARALNSLDEAA